MRRKRWSCKQKHEPVLRLGRHLTSHISLMQVSLRFRSLKFPWVWKCIKHSIKHSNEVTAHSGNQQFRLVALVAAVLHRLEGLPGWRNQFSNLIPLDLRKRNRRHGRMGCTRSRPKSSQRKSLPPAVMWTIWPLSTDAGQSLRQPRSVWQMDSPWHLTKNSHQ